MSRMARQYQGVRAGKILAQIEPDDTVSDVPAKKYKPAPSLKHVKVTRKVNKKKKNSGVDDACVNEIVSTTSVIEDCHQKVSTIEDDIKVPKASSTTIIERNTFDYQEILQLQRLSEFTKKSKLGAKSLSLSDLTIDTQQIISQKRNESVSSFFKNEELIEPEVELFYTNVNRKTCCNVSTENIYQICKGDEYDEPNFTNVLKRLTVSTTDLTEDRQFFANIKRSTSAPFLTSRTDFFSNMTNFTDKPLSPGNTPDDNAVYQSNQNDAPKNDPKEGENDRSISPSLLANSGHHNEKVDGVDYDSDDNYQERDITTDCDSEKEDYYGDMTAGHKRRHVAKKEEWKKNKAKLLRMRGEEYLGYAKQETNKYRQIKNRSPKRMKEACVSGFCRKSKLRGCNLFHENTRQDIHTYFWKCLNWDQRKVYVRGLVSRTKTSITKKSEGISRRQDTLKYSLPQKNNAGNVQVCQLMFLNTLSLTSTTVKRWTKISEFDKPLSQENGPLVSSQDGPTAENPAQHKKRILVNYLNQLAKMPSHYARKETRKLFLEPVFHTVTDVYKAYKDYCINIQEPAVSRYTFDNEFKEMNLSIFTLKKDMCDICVKHKEGNYDEHEYQMHIIKKNRAREEKEKDKKDAAKGDFILLTMDLEAVKMCPYLKASALYFKTKLTCHNFTMFDLTSRHCKCYWFNETTADLTASTFASLIIDYLEQHCLPKQKPIVIFSDGCSYQNRNVILANALLNFSIKHKVTITQKYLEPGHTQMECDSVHSAIERKLADREIHLPSDYVSVTKEARSINPYETVEIDHKFVKNYADNSSWIYKSIRPGRKTGDPTVTDIRVILYNQEETLKVKLNFDDDWLTLPQRPNRVNQNTNVNYSILHNNRIPIAASKFKHLQELKDVLPSDCHLFYDSLPHL